MRGRFLLPLILTFSAYAHPILAGSPVYCDIRSDAANQVPALLKTLKDDPEDSRRAAAAEQLKYFDGSAFPDILTALTESLKCDPSSDVRHEAAQAIGRIRPISPKAGLALEHALDHDVSMRVRIAARTALWQYYLLGYRKMKNLEPMAGNLTAEPPLAVPMPAKPTSPIPNTPAFPIRLTSPYNPLPQR